MTVASEMGTAIKQFSLLVHPNDLSERERLSTLACALDNLAYIYHRIPEAADNLSDVEAPGSDYPSYRARYIAIGALFPALGLYICSNNSLTEKPIVGDAIDDLADIARDLEEVSWYLDQGEESTALWHYRFGFQAHWGKHLRDLSVCLHNLLTSSVETIHA